MCVKHGKHSTYNLNVHLVFVVKHRRNVISGNVHNVIMDSFLKTCDMLDAELVEFGSDRDHVLINYPPTLSVSEIVQKLKTNSSRNVR